MRNVLHELFNGELSREQIEFEKDKAYARAINSAVIAEEELLETLTEKQKMLFRVFESSMDEANAVLRREDYAAGFQTGARIMMVVLEDKPSEIQRI